MKVGDLVIVNTQRIILKIEEVMTGIIIDIKDPEKMMQETYEQWQVWTGPNITVLWSNGDLTINTQSILQTIEKEEFFEKT